MSDHPIEGLMNVTMQKIKEMVDVNTIIGEPISTSDGTTIIPISKVSYGFASGGSDIPSKNAPNKEIFGGGSGAGFAGPCADLPSTKYAPPAPAPSRTIAPMAMIRMRLSLPLFAGTMGCWFAVVVAMNACLFR